MTLQRNFILEVQSPQLGISVKLKSTVSAHEASCLICIQKIPG